jgi:hypothetical protein
LGREETRASIPAAKVPEFLGLFNDTLAETWTAYRKAKAIEGVTRIKLTDPTLTPHRLPRIWPTA